MSTDPFEDLMRQLEADEEEVSRQVRLMGRILILVVIVAMFAAWWMWAPQ